MLLSKLPGSARDKWSRKALTIRQYQRREPELSDFIKFVDNEALIVRNPLFSKDAVDEYLEKIPNHKRNKISAFATREQSKKGIHIYASTAMEITNYRSARNSWKRH